MQNLITIEKLKENRNEILAEITSRNYIANCSTSEFMNAMVNKISTYEFDVEETVLFNITMMMNELFRMNFSDTATKEKAKNNNTKSLRNIMSSLHENEEYCAMSKTWKKI